MRLLNEGLSVSSSLHSVGIVGVSAFLELHRGCLWTVSSCLELHESSSRVSVQTSKFYVLPITP